MVLINGYFLCRKITGIERSAIEITRRLDKLILPGEISIIVPGDCESVPEYKNINVIKHKKKIPHILWQIFTLQIFLLRNPRYTILEFGNTCLPFAPGIVFLHDIYCEFFPEDFSSFRDKIVRLYTRWQYRLIAHRAKRICSVSLFSKYQIATTYSISPERITVIYGSWDHFSAIKPDYSVFDDFSILSKPFYFTLGSITKRKNLKWIMDYAIKHKNDLFAVSGDVMPTASGILSGTIPKNIIMLGYLNDSRVKALMEKCKAFLMPSYYEGFGIPPLEALSCGAQIIISNAASLPEIYGNTAHYIDPFNTDVELDLLLKTSVESPERILKKYSYDNSAKMVYDLIKGLN